MKNSVLSLFLSTGNDNFRQMGIIGCEKECVKSNKDLFKCVNFQGEFDPLVVIEVHDNPTI